MSDGVWKKGTRRITGKWMWSWHQQRFLIYLNGRDPITGESRGVIESFGESPEFNGWKLVENESLVAK